MPATSGAFRGPAGGGWAVSRSPASGRAIPPRRRRYGFDYDLRIVAVAFGLIAVFGAGLLLSGYVPFSLSLRPGMDLGLRDDSNFGHTRIGEVLFITGPGSACRKNQFYNDSGLFGPDVKVRCDTGLPDDQTASVGRGANSGRLMSIRDHFIQR